MIDFLCEIFRYLAGGLIGWLLAGWFAQHQKYSGSLKDRIVEKQVDNPEHLALINRLQSENKEISVLKTKLSGSESAKGKTVDNPAHVKKISELEAQVKNLKKNSNKSPQAAISSSAKTVDNSVHLKKINELEAQVRNLKSSSSKTSATTTTKTVDNPNHLKRIKELEAQVSNYQATTPKAAPKKSSSDSKPTSKKKANNDKASTSSANDKTSSVDKAAAKAAGFKVKAFNGKDDFTVVEGIGPKINELIHNANIHSYKELGKSSVKNVQKILDDAGPRYKLAKPGTWPTQAEMAAENKWEELKTLQDELDGGK